MSVAFIRDFFLDVVTLQDYTSATTLNTRQKMRFCLQRGRTLLQESYNDIFRSVRAQYLSDQVQCSLVRSAHFRCDDCSVIYRVIETGSAIYLGLII